MMEAGLLNRTLFPVESGANSEAGPSPWWRGGMAVGGNHLELNLFSVFQTLAIPVSLLVGEKFQINWS